MTSYGATVSTKRCLVCITLIAHLEIIAETVQGGPSFCRMLLVFQGVKFETGNVRYMMARQIFSQLCCIIYKRNTVYNISDIKHCSNDENRVHCKISKDTCAFL